MTDKNKFYEEEYQFPPEEFMGEELEQTAKPVEEEVVAEQSQDSPSSRGLANIWANNKRIIIIIGAVALIGLGFGAMRTLHKPAEILPATQPSPPPAPVVNTVMDPQVIDQLTSLKQDSANNNAIIRQLQGQVIQLTNSLNQSRTAQQQANQNLLTLAAQVQQLAAEVKVLSHPKPAPVAKAEPKVEVPVITFQLRAVVPGRAWIVGSDGQSHSVAIGDQIPQYGSVQSIDADAGVVITTSGKNIKF